MNILRKFQSINQNDSQLCRNNRWIEKISIEARPLDCGVLSGMTFTSPVFKSIPQERVYKITPKFPNHHASSFFYEEDQSNSQLPPIAYFRLTKIKEYIGVKEKSVKRIHQKYRRFEFNDRKIRAKINSLLFLQTRQHVKQKDKDKT